MPVIYTTSDLVAVIVEPGSKSPFDFIVRYAQPLKRIRTPKHIHFVVDLFAKRTGNPELTNALLDHIIDIIMKVQAATSFPPEFQVFNPADVQKFDELSQYGEYSVEFLLTTIELIMIQEKTNYPNGIINLRLFQKFRAGADIYSIVSAATFR